MRRSGAHLGRVTDGDRVLGLVALEDVLERLIGDVRGADVRDAAGSRPTAPQPGAGAGGR
jgi:CBS domain containing-hemolysin-like protein